MTNKVCGTFQQAPIISDQISAAGLGVVWRELGRVLQADVPGDVTEFGCYIGTTSLFLRRQLDAFDRSAVRALHVYDSFAGLPAKTAADSSTTGEAFQAGELAVSKKELLRQFKVARLTPPIVHKGWFEQLRASDVPDNIAFAFLDGDFYSSIMAPLRLVWSRMSTGGCIVIDDFQREALPGVDQALHDFFAGRRDKPDIRTEAGKGIIRL